MRKVYDRIGWEVEVLMFGFWVMRGVAFASAIRGRYRELVSAVAFGVIGCGDISRSAR